MGKPLANQGIGAVLSGFTLLARHSHSYCRMLQESSCLPLGSQQRPYFTLQRLISRTCIPKECLTLFGRKVQNRLQQRFDLFPSLRVHR
jgi:hypothetical protein